jgi:hypothetical protein
VSIFVALVFVPEADGFIGAARQSAIVESPDRRSRVSELALHDNHE